MISTLEDLIEPLTTDAFSNLLATRALTFRRAEGANRFSGLLDWEALRQIVQHCAVPPRHLSITRDSAGVPEAFYRDADKVSGAKLDALMRSGASLAVEFVEPYVPAVAALCADIGAKRAEQVWATAIATTGTGGAFKTHYDSFDLVVLPLEGSKRWRIFSPTVAFPVTPMSPRAKPSDTLVFDEVLRPGDFLVVPSGYWHRCENGEGLSLHCSISLRPPTGFGAMRALVVKLRDEELFRLPLTRFGGAAQRAAHEAALKARLMEEIGRLALAEAGGGADDPETDSGGE